MPTRTKAKKPARTGASTAAGRKRAPARAPGRGAKPKARARKPKKATPRKPKGRARSRSPAARRRTATRLSRLRLPGLRRASLPAGRWRRRLVFAGIVLVALAAGYFGWLRDSSVVAVRDVEVAGVSGSQQQRIEKALTKAAKEMTTLHVDEKALAAAAATFPDVRTVTAEPSFPNGLTVDVEQRRPALIARGKSQTLAVAEDGALLPGVKVEKDAKLPAIDVGSLPESGLLEGQDLEQALVVGAAPEPLRPLLEGVAYEEDEGVVITLAGGLPVHFGTGGRADAKWAAAAAVLADPKLDRLSYVDVRVPERAAAGGAASPPAVEEPPAPVDPAAPAIDPAAGAAVVPPAAEPAAAAP